MFSLKNAWFSQSFGDYFSTKPKDIFSNKKQTLPITPHSIVLEPHLKSHPSPQISAKLIKTQTIKNKIFSFLSNPKTQIALATTTTALAILYLCYKNEKWPNIKDFYQDNDNTSNSDSLNDNALPTNIDPINNNQDSIVKTPEVKTETHNNDPTNNDPTNNDPTNNDKDFILKTPEVKIETQKESFRNIAVNSFTPTLTQETNHEKEIPVHEKEIPVANLQPIAENSNSLNEKISTIGQQTLISDQSTYAVTFGLALIFTIATFVGCKLGINSEKRKRANDTAESSVSKKKKQFNRSIFSSFTSSKSESLAQALIPSPPYSIIYIEKTPTSDATVSSHDKEKTDQNPANASALTLATSLTLSSLQSPTGLDPLKRNEVSFNEISTEAKKAPTFNNYHLNVPEKFQETLKSLVVTKNKDTEFNGLTIPLSSIQTRPVDLLMKALFNGKDIKTPEAGNGGFFRFTPFKEAKKYLNNLRKSAVIQKPINPIEDFSFSAENQDITIQLETKLKGENEDKYVKEKLSDGTLSDFWGTNTFNISGKEIGKILDSQRIYLSPLMPITFYKGLKAAMQKDGVKDLQPPKDFIHETVVLKDWLSSSLFSSNTFEVPKEIKKFFTVVSKDPNKFGFDSEKAYNDFLQLSLYQIGAMVVKSEDFYLLIDENYKIADRVIGSTEPFRLINACGIRSINKTKNPTINKQIMKETFNTAFVAAENGIIICPAVGMGVWRGDPELYWNAFLDAVEKKGNTFDAIIVNPNHQKTQEGKFKDHTGEEFAKILKARIDTSDSNSLEYKNLKKILNLGEKSTDVLILAHQLKQTFKDTTVSLINASDPDVTLGGVVGEYMLNCPHSPSTTEEHYSMLGTNLLNFEEFTGVHEDPKRIFQVLHRTVKDKIDDV